MIDLYPAPEHQLAAPEPPRLRWWQSPPLPELPPWPDTADGWMDCIAHPLQIIGWAWIAVLAVKYGPLIVLCLLALFV
jgi:hypothetical protein